MNNTRAKCVSKFRITHVFSIVLRQKLATAKNGLSAPATTKTARRDAAAGCEPVVMALPATKLDENALWGSQSWLQPPFQAAGRLKAGCRQDCLPHKTFSNPA